MLDLYKNRIYLRTMELKLLFKPIIVSIIVLLTWKSVAILISVGHFYLTQLLLPLLRNSRVINVSSIVHYFIKPRDLDYSLSNLKENYDSFTSYAFSKLAQVYHASELTRRYGIKAYSLHPGTIVTTNFKTRQRLFAQLIVRSLFFISKTTEQGAMTSLYCALSDDAKPGCYHSDCQVTEPSNLALNAYRADECWSESERLINEKIKWFFASVFFFSFACLKSQKLNLNLQLNRR